MNKTIEIIVSPQGKTTLETKGFSGAECRDASKFLEAALGQCQSEKLTAGFHTATTCEQNRAQQQG